MLQTIHRSFDDVALPAEVVDFVADLEQRVNHFVDGKPFAENGFVACDHRAIAQALVGIRENQLATGELFCEWGSGFGGVASLASMLGFEAYGIEINPEVLDHSVRLADDYGVSAEFIEGSFIPSGAEDLIDSAFLDTEGDLTLEYHPDDAYGDLGLEVVDFDVIFVFPWPTEAPLLSRIFDRFAAAGALLLTFNDFSGLHIQRKC